MFSRGPFKENEGNNPKKAGDRKELRIIIVNKNHIFILFKTNSCTLFKHTFTFTFKTPNC
jgi:hypothetical protein